MSEPESAADELSPFMYPLWYCLGDMLMRNGLCVVEGGEVGRLLPESVLVFNFRCWASSSESRRGSKDIASGEGKPVFCVGDELLEVGSSQSSVVGVLASGIVGIAVEEPRQ